MNKTRSSRTSSINSHSNKTIKKCRMFAKKMTNLAVSMKSLVPSNKNKKINKGTIYKKMLKEVCNTNNCKDMEKEGVFKGDVVNGFNKRYSKKTRNALRKLGAISLCK